MSGHSDMGIFSYLGACSLDMLSMTFAAVICDADDLCAVNTAKDPESFFTTSPRSTT